MLDKFGIRSKSHGNLSRVASSLIYYLTLNQSQVRDAQESSSASRVVEWQSAFRNLLNLTLRVRSQPPNRLNFPVSLARAVMPVNP